MTCIGSQNHHWLIARAIRKWKRDQAGATREHVLPLRRSTRPYDAQICQNVVPTFTSASWLCGTFSSLFQHIIQQYTSAIYISAVYFKAPFSTCFQWCVAILRDGSLTAKASAARHRSVGLAETAQKHVSRRLSDAAIVSSCQVDEHNSLTTFALNDY